MTIRTAPPSPEVVDLLRAFVLRLLSAAALREEGLRQAKARRGGRRGPAGAHLQALWVAIAFAKAANRAEGKPDYDHRDVAAHNDWSRVTRHWGVD